MVLFHPSIHLTIKNYCCYNQASFKSLVEYFTFALYLTVVFIFVLFNKRMKVLTDTSYKEDYDLYTKIHGLIAINSCQIGLAQKDIILLSNASLIAYKAGKQTSLTNTEFIKFILWEGIYSTDDFNVKIKIAILQQRQGWEPPQIKDLKLVIPKDYFFMADNAFFYALGIQDKYLEKTTLIRSNLPPVLIRHLLTHHLLQKFYRYTASKLIRLEMS